MASRQASDPQRIRSAVTAGIATGLVGIFVTLIPVVARYDEGAALQVLFAVRGSTQPPPNVVIVSVDEAAAERAAMPPQVREWPRTAFATLVDRLVARGASLIAFDIQFFRHTTTESDRAFADAIARSGRVVLVQRLERLTAGNQQLWERQDPIPPLAEAAVGLAPVPMPDVPQLSWAWSFLATPTGDVPTLAALLLQLRALPVTSDFLTILRRAGMEDLDTPVPAAMSDIQNPLDLTRLMQTLRQQFQSTSGAGSLITADAERSGTPADRASLLLALGELYDGSGERYLNFYGRPGTICTIPYDAAVRTGGDCALDDAVVFVGLSNTGIARPGQLDTYHTVYPSSEGVDFSGVELQATLFANLLDRSSIRPTFGPATAAILMGVGVSLGVSIYGQRTLRRRSRPFTAARWHAALTGIAVACIYSVIVLLAFRADTLLPLFVPLVVQLPVALGLGLLMRPVPHRDEVLGVCLATDAGGSTAIGQRLPHEPYAQLMEKYRRLLVNTVLEHGGDPVPPEGDGLVCVWCIPPEADFTAIRTMRLRACEAALAIVAEAEQFNEGLDPDRRLPTRVGVNLGTLTVHSDADRGIFEIVGDVVNIAARLRDAQRDGRSRVLAAAAVVVDLDEGLEFRRIEETVALKGVTQPVAVVELLRLKSALRHDAQVGG